MRDIRNFIPTVWSAQMLYRMREENKAIEKIKKANLTEEQKINATCLIYGGLYKSAYYYIRGCQEFARMGKCGTHTVADIAEDLPRIYGKKEFWKKISNKKEIEFSDEEE